MSLLKGREGRTGKWNMRILKTKKLGSQCSLVPNANTNILLSILIGQKSQLSTKYLSIKCDFTAPGTVAFCLILCWVQPTIFPKEV